MTAPNHIAGGIVITGIFCSLWNINIFENPVYITTCVIGSLLPDIDHTKSIIGKAVYPLAKWLSVKYGHRTITHSLLFLFFVTLTTYLLEHFNLLKTDGHSISFILFFAVFSHLLLDMVTIQGIPLFYPFYRNPCVLPANVELRIQTGNLKQEGIVLFILAFFTIFLQDLFKNGFWFTYNKSFNDITHLHREFENSNQLLKVDYNFNLFQNKHKGKGYLVYADFQQCYILSDTLIHLKTGKQGQAIKVLNPIKTNGQLTILQKNFSNISIDSVNQFLKRKFISTAKIFATQKIDVITKKGLENELFFNLKNEYNLRFISSIKDSLNQAVANNIKEVEYKIKLEEDHLRYTNQKYYTAKNKISKLKSELSLLQESRDFFKINEIKNELIVLKRVTDNFNFKRSKTLQKLNKQLQELQNNVKAKDIYLSGEVNYFVLPTKKK